jgi:hypothetical protein
MILQRKHTLFNLRYAVIGQPIALLVILMIASVIIAVFCVSIPDRMKEEQRQHIEEQVNKILVEASLMFEYGDNGSQQTIQLNFPSSMRFIVFGHIPVDSAKEPTNLSLDEQTSNNCYYVMEDGTIHPYHSNARFSNHNMTQMMLFHPGTYIIILELRQKEGRPYVTMREQ